MENMRQDLTAKRRGHENDPGCYQRHKEMEPSCKKPHRRHTPDGREKRRQLLQPFIDLVHALLRLCCESPRLDLFDKISNDGRNTKIGYTFFRLVAHAFMAAYM